MGAVQQLDTQNLLDHSKRVDLSKFALLRDVTVSPEQVAADLKKIRAPKEMQALRDRMHSLAGVFSRNYNLRVVPSPVGRWGLALKPETLAAVQQFLSGEMDTLRELPTDAFSPSALLYNLNDVALADEEQVLAKVRHEAQHARLTDYRFLFEGQKAARTQKCLPSSFGLVQLACEDARVSFQSCRDSQSAKDNIRESLRGHCAEIDAKINEQPLPRQLALNLFFGRWLTDQDLPSLRNPLVLAASEALAPVFSIYLTDTDNNANYELFLRDILPHLQELESASIQEEMQRLLASDIADLEKREYAVKKHFFSRMGRGIKRFFWRSPIPPYEAAICDGSRSIGGAALRRTIADAVEPQRMKFEERDEELRSAGKEVGRLRNAVDLSILPAELRAALENICQQFPQDLKKELYHRALMSINDAQSEAFSRELPIGLALKKPNQNPYKQQICVAEAPSPEEIDRMWQSLEPQADAIPQRNIPPAEPSEEEKEKQSAERIRAELRRREIARDGFTEQEQADYRSFKSLEVSVVSGVGDFIEQLRPYLPKKRGYRQGDELFVTGNKLDGRALSKKVPIRDFRIYTRREPVDTPDPRIFVALLIDNSGSMQGTKMEESMKTAIFWARALEELGVPFAIKLFGENVTRIKDFDQSYDDPVERIKPTLMHSATASEENTDIGSPLQQTVEEMRTFKRKRPDLFGAVFVISDGGANLGMVEGELQQYIRQTQREFVTMNFNLGSEENAVFLAQAYFGTQNVIAPATFMDLPRESMRVLGAVLKEAFARTMGIRS